MIGRGRPVEQDALRILTIIHQLGEHAEGAWWIDFESQLRSLDHLVRHEVDLAYVVMDQVRAVDSGPGSRRTELAKRVRQLLRSSGSSPIRPAALRPLGSGSWERLDDVLAFLTCRELLRVEPLAVPGTRYRLTTRADLWLRQSVYPDAAHRATSRQRCALLRDILPADLLRPPDGPALESYLQQAGERLDDLRLEEQIRLEEDMLSRLFQIVFLESL